MLKYFITKEFLFAFICTIFIYSVFQRFNFHIVEPSKENMKNVNYHYDDDYNTN